MTDTSTLNCTASAGNEASEKPLPFVPAVEGDYRFFLLRRNKSLDGLIDIELGFGNKVAAGISATVSDSGDGTFYPEAWQGRRGHGADPVEDGYKTFPTERAAVLGVCVLLRQQVAQIHADADSMLTEIERIEAAATDKAVTL